VPSVAPSPIPAPLPPWARVLVQVAPFIEVGLQHALEYIGPMFAAGHSAPSEWRRFTYYWHDPNDADAANDAVTKFDIVNITQGQIDNTWTQADLDTVYTNLDGLVNLWSTNYMDVAHRVYRSKTYRMMFTDLPTEPIIPPDRDKPYVKSGAPLEDRPIVGQSGSSAGQQAPQVALTTTNRTAYRLHWGRNYWPFPAAAHVLGSGHATAALVDAMANNTRACFTALGNAELFPVVPVVQINNAPARALLGITDVQVDDIFDVQRRRRLKNATRVSRASDGP